MKLNYIKGIVSLKKIKEKINFKNKNSFIKNIGNRIIKELKKENKSHPIWISRAIFLTKIFFNEDTPKSISLDDILDFVEFNKNSKLIDYLNSFPDLKYKDFVLKKNVQDNAYAHHKGVVMQLNKIEIFKDYFKVKDFIDKNKINTYLKNGFIIYNNKLFYNGDSWIIEDYSNSYIFKENELETYLKTKDLQNKPVKFLKLYFH